MCESKNYPNPFNLLIVVFVMTVMFAGIAEAGAWDKIKGMLSMQFWAYAATGLVFIFGTFGAVLFSKTTTTMKESAEFLNVLAAAIEDKKVSKEELLSIVKEGKDVINVFSRTPEKFKVT